MKKIIYILIALISFWGCKPNSPSGYRGLPKEYKVAYEEVYGHCYDSVPYAVVALDLYSDGLDLDANHRIKGTGYNLYISDIFVPDSLLESGSYCSNLSAEPFTFLPGRDYEGYPYGMYVLTIDEDKVTQIQVLDSGAFVYQNDSLAFTLYYTNVYGYRATYNCLFHGSLIPWQKQ